MAKEHRSFRRSARMHLSQSVIFGLSMRGMFQPIESHIRGKKIQNIAEAQDSWNERCPAIAKLAFAFTPR
jgi:hypothetical protein